MPRFSFASFLAIVLSFTSFVHAQTNTSWNDTNGDWSDVSNWTNGMPDGFFQATLSGNTANVAQDMAGLNLWGLNVNTGSANLVLDNSLTITNHLDFQAGQISGQADINLAHGATASLGGTAVFIGGGAGTLRVNGTAIVEDAFHSNGFFELSGDGVIDGAGLLSVNNAFTWDGGTMTGSGVTELTTGSLVKGGTLDRTVENSAGLILTGSGLVGTSNAVWNNRTSSGLFKISGDESLLGAGTFNNLEDSFLKKSGGSGLSVIEWDVVHEGQMILVEVGTLSLQGSSFLNGQLMVDESAVLDFNGDTEFGSNASNAGDGTISLSGGTATFAHNYNADLDTEFSGVTVANSGQLNFNRDVDIRNAVFNGNGTIALNSTGTIANASIESNFLNSGQLSVEGGNNVFAGNFNQSEHAELYLNQAEIEFGSDVAIELQGNLTGSGIIRSESVLIVEGTVAPGPDIGELLFEGDLEFRESAVLNFQLDEQLQSDLISVTGDLTLDGSIAIDVAENATTGVYTLFEYGGTLSDLGIELLLHDGVRGDLYNNVGSRQVELRVTSIPEPFAGPLLAGMFLFSARRKK